MASINLSPVAEVTGDGTLVAIVVIETIIAKATRTTIVVVGETAVVVVRTTIVVIVEKDGPLSLWWGSLSRTVWPRADGGNVFSTWLL